MQYVTAEQTEEPVKSDHQYAPTSLPQFKKQKNPLTQLDGDVVFTQDEPARVKAFAFGSQEAASLLTAEAEACRSGHEGHLLRQQITVERCSIVEYS